MPIRTLYCILKPFQKLLWWQTNYAGGFQAWYGTTMPYKALSGLLRPSEALQGRMPADMSCSFLAGWVWYVVAPYTSHILSFWLRAFLHVYRLYGNLHFHSMWGPHAITYRKLCNCMVAKWQTAPIRQPSEENTPLPTTRLVSSISLNSSVEAKSEPVLILCARRNMRWRKEKRCNI